MRLTLLAAARGANRLARPFHVVRAMRIGAPERLRIAPPDIRTADSTVADEIYAGYFSFDGKTVSAHGRSPFAVNPPSAAWRRSLAGFSWLRHLRAADKALACENARALVADFLALRRPAADDPAFEPAVTARRTLSFLAQSPLLLEESESEFYDSFMESLAQGARVLSRALGAGEAAGADRIVCAIALAEFSICADAQRDTFALAARLLTRELDRQILSDGGHIGRNPRTISDLLLDLLPLRQVYAARGVHPPEALLRAIDRMFPMLRLLQHGDGSLALFNGMGATAQDRLATIFAHDRAPGAIQMNAPYAGYQRLEAGEALVIADCGAPPPIEYSRFAHAGVLSFEYSLGFERVVVNCGAPRPQYEAASEAARATAAHSTLTLDNRSSCRIAAGAGSGRWLGGRVVDGPRIVGVDRRQSKSGLLLELSHDGYARDYRLVHERILALTHDGSRLIGEDRLVPVKGATHAAAASDFAVRFHLHPRVRPTPVGGGSKIELALPSGALLLFEAKGFTPAIEESVFFAAPEGPRKTSQIVVTGRVGAQAKLRWSFRRVTERQESETVPPAADV